MKDKILVLGGSGLVGSRVVDLLSDQFDLIAPGHDQLDVTNAMQVKDGVEEIKPTLILYAAGFTDVDLAEQKKEECLLLNVKAVEFFAAEAAKLNVPFYYLSTDYVFDGTKEDRPYTEEDAPNPVDSVYAKSKRNGELVALAGNSKNGVIRLIMPFSAVYKRKMDLPRLILDKLKKGAKVTGIVDQKVNPIFVDDLVWGMAKILQNRASGIYHLGATSFTTPNGFIRQLASKFNLPQNLVEDITFQKFSKTRKAKRPQNTWLDTTKFRTQFGDGILHTIEQEISMFKSQVDSPG